jgi:hypothetical protein
MSKNINFRDEVLSYLDSKFILKEEKIWKPIHKLKRR